MQGYEAKMTETLGLLASSMIVQQSLFPELWTALPDTTPFALQEITDAKRVADTFATVMPLSSHLKGLLAAHAGNICLNGNRSLTKGDLRPLSEIARILRSMPADDYLAHSHAVAKRMVDAGFLFLNYTELEPQIRELVFSFQRTSDRVFDEEDRQAAAATARAVGKTEGAGPVKEAVDWWLWAETKGLSQQELIQQAKKEQEKAKKLGLLLTDFPDLFTSKNVLDLVDAANTQFAVASGLGKLMLSRVDIFRREHIPFLIELAKTHGAPSLGLAFLAFTRSELFEAGDIPVLLSIAKKSEIKGVARWMLATVRYPRILRWLMGKGDNRALGVAWVLFCLAEKQAKLFEKGQMTELATVGNHNIVVRHAFDLLLARNPAWARL